MSGDGPGGGTSFEDMSHEQMLAWLDQANAGMVKGAADQLLAAAEEIRKIAEELKIRPQWVEWKGEGAHAFRAWSADLANSTLRLGDFSEGAGKWLGEASGAIAQAQASIPRDTKGTQANLDAAKAAHNHPDAATVSAKSESEPAALAANREKVRLEAAAQMRKLGQTYDWSATQMDALERPKFPPPPKAIVPPGSKTIDAGEAKARPGVSAQGAAASAAAASGVAASGVAAAAAAAAGTAEGRERNVPSGAVAVRRPLGVSSHEQHAAPAEATGPSRMDMDSAATLPKTSHTPTDTTANLPAPERMTDGAAPHAGPVPPVSGGGGRVPGTGPAVRGRAPGTGRMPVLPVLPGQEAVPNPVRTPGGTGVAGGDAGIVGGRPVASPVGRPTGAVPRGVVVGGEGTAARGPMGPTAGATNPVGRVARQQGRQVPGPRPSFSNGGVVGGRPIPGDGVVGGPRSPRSGSSTNTGGRSGRSYRVAEDEETWRRGERRAVPPVID
ncbi:translation initiation factor IF-2 [Streptomyces sp. NPDC048297]|uniref:translation initiation factor IF-2 n=1 Tax=Streptomyces sp. NPDC048297 TaxID=3365531 RepID=UPI0037208ABD